MGVDLASLVWTEAIRLEELKSRRVAVDANNILHQFLSSIRASDGRPLKDSEGNVTSHLIGLLYRSTRLIRECWVRLLFVFDGEPPRLKEEEMERRRARREEARREWKEALEEGDYATARSKAMVSSRLTGSMLDDAKRMLKLLGIPFVQAPGEAEAQSAYMAKKEDVWAVNSRDYDALLFGTPRLIRYLTFSSKRTPQLIDRQRLLTGHGITLKQLVDIAILIGTDYNDGVRGVGPKTALKLIKRHNRIEELPKEVRSKVSGRYEDIREIFLEPDVSRDYSLQYGDLKEEELYRFLCGERGLSEDRVGTAVNRMKEFYSLQERKEDDTLA